jgi:hypothetical protein
MQTTSWCDPQVIVAIVAVIVTALVGVAAGIFAWQQKEIAREQKEIARQQNEINQRLVGPLLLPGKVRLVGSDSDQQRWHFTVEISNTGQVPIVNLLVDDLVFEFTEAYRGAREHGTPLSELPTPLIQPGGMETIIVTMPWVNVTGQPAAEMVGWVRYMKGSYQDTATGKTVPFEYAPFSEIEKTGGSRSDSTSDRG